MRIWVVGRITLVIMVVTAGLLGPPAFGARGRRSAGGSGQYERGGEAYQEGERGEQEDRRKRTVGAQFALEEELSTDRTIDTWIYVFSAVMLLCVGWLCFKPTRTGLDKSRKSAARTGSKQGGPAKNRAKKAKK